MEYLRKYFPCCFKEENKHLELEDKTLQQQIEDTIDAKLQKSMETVRTEWEDRWAIWEKRLEASEKTRQESEQNVSSLQQDLESVNKKIEENVFVEISTDEAKLVNASVETQTI